MWVTASYQMVSLFSLKTSAATGSGAKSLLVPTPYALKMALLDAACRTLGVAQAEVVWPAIREARVALDPPPSIVVTNLFTRILKPRRGEAEKGSGDEGPFGRTIAFREYVQHPGALGVSFEVAGSENEILQSLLLQITYFGKRGGFVQLQAPPECVDGLPVGYILVNGDQNQFDIQGVIQMLDDCAPSLTFQRANIYSGERVTVGKERVIRHVVLPYRLARSSKSFSLYERID